jgi:hypothetical protein
LENQSPIGYTRTMKRMGLGLLGVLAIACGGGEVDCSMQMRSDWAIEITFTETGDSCPYVGTLTLEGGTTEDLKCNRDSGSCRCIGGEEFGIYEITLTDTNTDTTERAVIEVEAAASPICYQRDALEDFTPVDGMGGGGGAGGAG